MPVTQTVEFPGSTGLDAGATAKLYPPGSDIAAATASAVVESTNRKGIYQATFADVPAGNYLLAALDANGNPICVDPLNGLTLTAATFQTASIANSSLEALAVADEYIDTTTDPTHWARVKIKRGTGGIGTGTELLRQPLYDTSGNPLNSNSVIVGAAHA